MYKITSRRCFQTFVIVLLVVGGVILPARRASAHILKEDNGVSTVMHIQPDDKPKAGEVTTILLDYDAGVNHFRLKDCTCTVSFTENDRKLTAAPLEPAFPGAEYDAITKVTFPRRDVYKLTVRGSSNGQQFGEFSISYDIRVALSSQAASSQANDTRLVIILSTAGLAIIAILAQGFYNNHRKSSKAKKD